MNKVGGFTSTFMLSSSTEGHGFIIYIYQWKGGFQREVQFISHGASATSALSKSTSESNSQYLSMIRLTSDSMRMKLLDDHTVLRMGRPLLQSQLYTVGLKFELGVSNLVGGIAVKTSFY